MVESTGARRHRSGFAFRDLPIAWKLRGLAVMVCALLLTIGLVGIVQLGSTQERLAQLYHANLHDVRMLGDVRAGYRTVRLEMRGLALAQDAAGTTAATRLLDTAIAALDEDWATLAAGRTIDAGSHEQEFATSWATYKK